jgi:MFS family permease
MHPPSPAAPVRKSDLRLLFAARMVRMFAYGMLGVALVLYLAATGLEASRIGLLLTLTLLGDSVISLLLGARADRWGRRRTLIVGAMLMTFGGAGLALGDDFFWLLLAATIGVVSPTGSEVGPFLAVEQACLAQVSEDHRRTSVFAWYNVAGFAATALGALAGGALSSALQSRAWPPLESYRALLWIYAAIGVVIGLLALRLGPEVEAPVARSASVHGVLGLSRARGVVARLSALFALDSFAGGFILQSFLAYWFHLRFGADEAVLGAVFFGTNLLSGVSALVAVPLARRFGLVNTMVWTHLPSNLLLMGVPFMPDFGSTVALLLVRHTLSQMDVPTRQSYVNAIVPADERSAANGATGTARQLGGSLAPLFAGPLIAGGGAAAAPFLIAGGLKVVYDLALWRAFRHHRPPEERATGSR